MHRFYTNQVEFETVNDRIRRGDIVGAKGQPSKYILHDFRSFSYRVL
jgi:hypothetical protein